MPEMWNILSKFLAGLTDQLGQSNKSHQLTTQPDPQTNKPTQKHTHTKSQSVTHTHTQKHRITQRYTHTNIPSDPVTHSHTHILCHYTDIQSQSHTSLFIFARKEILIIILFFDYTLKEGNKKVPGRSQQFIYIDMKRRPPTLGRKTKSTPQITFLYDV